MKGLPEKKSFARGVKGVSPSVRTNSPRFEEPTLNQFLAARPDRAATED